MRISGFLIITVIIIYLTGCAAPTVIVNKREVPEEKLAVELIPDLKEQMDFHERSGFYYAFEYDSNNLYISLATSDNTLQRKMLLFGFTVWVDRTGGKNEQQGFKFPVGVRMPSDSRERGIPVYSMGYRGGSAEEMLAWAEEIDLIGIYGSSTRRVKMRDSQVRVKAEIVDDILIYQALIPYGILKFGYNPIENKLPISIGLETGYLESPAAGRRPQPYDGRRPGGGVMQPGRMPGGQYPGGMMPSRGMMDQRPPDIGAMSRPTRLWIKLEFAL